MKYYIIYKTTNIINNKIYVGLHGTNDLEDGYLGSGIFIKKAIKKYGKINFIKEIMFIFDNKLDMINKEKEIVNENFINRGDVYNMVKGGYGLSTLSESKRSETIEKIRKANLERDSSVSSKKRIETLLKKDSDIFKKMGIKSSIKQKENYKNGYVNPNQNLNDIFIFDNNGVLRYKCKRIDLPKLCVSEGLPERMLIKSLHNNGLKLYAKQPPTKNEYLMFSGWYAIYENKLI